MHGHVFALIAFAWLGLAGPAPASASSAGPVVETRAKNQTTTGMWVGLRGGPPNLRTALAAALQTQATIRGIIDRVAPDVVSLQACAWNDVACFVTLGEHHDSRVLVVGNLSKHDDRYTLRVARINVELGQVIAEYHLEVDPQLTAIEIANDAIAGLTSEVIAAPSAIATPTDASSPDEKPARSRPKKRARNPESCRGSRARSRDSCR